jgi:lipooligosaccharide transport system permease protein
MSTPAAIRVWEGYFTFYRVHWKSNVFGAFVQPFLYLLGMGVGVGSLVDTQAGNDPANALGGLSYYEFLAPALLATTGMMLGAGEALWPTMAGFKWQRFFHAQAQTPLSTGQIVGGLTLWHATRAGIGVVGVGAVLALFSGTRHWGLLAAVPFGVLTGLAFASPLIAWAATRETERSFPNIMRFAITPLFLFGGAFYPVSSLPDWLEPVAKATPLWHGVELCRRSVHGTLSVAALTVHVAVLVGLAVLGSVLAQRAFRTRLAK